MSPSRVPLRFGPEIERAFWDERLERVLPQVRVALLTGAAALGAAWPISNVLFPAAVDLAHALVGGTALVSLLAAALTFAPGVTRWLRPLLAVEYLQFVLFPPFLVRVGDADLTPIGTLATVVLLIFLFVLSPLGFSGALAVSVPLLASMLWALVQPGMAPPRLLPAYLGTLISAYLGVVAAGYFLESGLRRDFLQRRGLAIERERSDRLLRNVLPDAIADRLRGHEDETTAPTIADRLDACTVLFADLVGFTSLSSTVTPEALVGILDLVFTAFDALVERHGVEKIKTIGDAYMAVGGLPTPRPDHAQAIVDLALDMLDTVSDLNQQHGWSLQVRIGVATGPVVAGVIGRKKFAYDLWGDTVNTASRMESHGVPGLVQVTESTRDALGGAQVLEPRGTIDVKGKGLMETYLLHPRSPPVDGSARGEAPGSAALVAVQS